MDKVRRADWGESAMLLLCALLFAFTPNRYTLGGTGVTFAFGLLIVIAFVMSIVWTAVGDRKFARLGVGITASVIAAAIALSLARIVFIVIYKPATVDAIRLLETAFDIWVGNVAVFAIAYRLLGEREFLFPRMEGEDPKAPMRFMDYIFLSFTTATAFSPTDTPPLTTRGRTLMMIEATISLVTIAIAAARAINIIPSGS